MKYRLVADIYYGLFDGSACETIKESDSLDEIESEFASASERFSARHDKAEFSSCHLIATVIDDSGNDAWSSLSHNEQTRLANLDISFE